jgi:hypothetical protein
MLADTVAWMSNGTRALAHLIRDGQAPAFLLENVDDDSHARLLGIIGDWLQGNTAAEADLRERITAEGLSRFSGPGDS